MRIAGCSLSQCVPLASSVKRGDPVRKSRSEVGAKDQPTSEKDYPAGASSDRNQVTFYRQALGTRVNTFNASLSASSSAP